MNNKVIAFLEIRFGKFLCALLTVADKIFAVFRSGLSRDKATQKVVFIKFIEQGALVLHLPAFKEAAHRYGKNNVFIVTFGSNEQLIEILNVFTTTNCFYLSEKSIFKFTITFWETIRKIRKNGIDSLIDLEFFSCATAIFSYLTGTSKRVGYHRYDGGQNYRGDLYTHKLSYSHYLSVGDTSWSMLQCLAANKTELPSLPTMDFPTTDTKIDFSLYKDYGDLAKLFPDHILPEQLIIINPSFQDVLPLRAWPVSYYHDYIGKILKIAKGYTIVFTGKENEFNDSREFIASIPEIRAVNLCGKTTLRNLFMLYTKADLLLTSDSGPGHFASLTNLPTIVLFGPETPVLYAPKAANVHVIYKSLPCSPCYNVYNNRMSACKNNQCLKTITVDEVVELSEKLMKR